MYIANLSRFQACTIKTPVLVDLMRMKEFRKCVDAYSGTIDDIWVLHTARQIERQMRMTDECAKYVIEQYGIESLRKHNRKSYKCRHIIRYLERTLTIDE